MRRLLINTLASLVVVLIGAYALWTDLPTDVHYLSDLRSQVALNKGQPGDNGNVLGIQPEMFSGDYHSVDLLRLKLAAYLHKARDEGLLNGKTVAVLPEHIGTWLVISGEKAEVYQALTLDNAMTWLAVSNPLKLGRAWLSAKGENRLHDALLRMKAEDMARDYQAVFGGLAKEFGITVVAGSIVLPEPRVEDGALRVGNGPLYNVSLVFGSDGVPLGQPQRKVFPTAFEHAFMAGAPASDLRVVDTPAGRLGVLIGADSLHPDTHAPLRDAELVVAPAFLTGSDDWPPSEVRMTVFFRGHLWDMSGVGHSQLASDGAVSEINDGGHGGRLLNIWL